MLALPIHRGHAALAMGVLMISLYVNVVLIETDLESRPVVPVFLLFSSRHSTSWWLAPCSESKVYYLFVLNERE
jgi:hypothetical protein